MARSTAVKVKIQKPKPLLILVIAVVLILCTVTLVSLHAAISSTRNQTDALRAQAHEQEMLTQRLERYIQELGTIQGIIRVAQEELGLIQPDAVVFDTQTGN